MNKREFIKKMAIGLVTVTSLKFFGKNNDNWIPIMVSDIENENCRIYPLSVVTNIKAQIQRLIDKKQCVVSYCPNIENNTEVINLNSVAGLINDVKLENGVLYIKWSLLKTPCGEIVKNYGQNFYMTTSGIGNINGGVVQNDYELIQFIISPTSSWEKHFKQKLV